MIVLEFSVLEYLLVYRVCFVVFLRPKCVGDYCRDFVQIEQMVLEMSSDLGMGLNCIL